MSVYFITAREIGRVKIGFSDGPRMRFVKVQSDSPIPLELERVCDGDKALEASLHARFAPARLRGEWFELTAEIEAYMATLPPLNIKPRAQSMNQQLITAIGCHKTLASQWLTGVVPMPLSVAVAFYNATKRCIGPMEGAEPHEAEVLAKYIKAWTPKKAAA